jgi:tRNA threonylcarbamoyladenosine biosynthesis protein TsaE
VGSGATTERAWLSRSEEATERLGEALGAALGPGTVIALDGELGAGKTCFVRGLARGLGVTTPIASPTYALMAEHAGRLTLYHFDAWMERRERAFLAEGGAEWFHQGGVCAVEWAERVSAALPEPRLAVLLAHAGPHERSVRIRTVGEPAGGPLARALDAIGALEGLDPIQL